LSASGLIELAGLSRLDNRAGLRHNTRLRGGARLRGDGRLTDAGRLCRLTGNGLAHRLALWELALSGGFALFLTRSAGLRTRSSVRWILGERYRDEETNKYERTGEQSAHGNLLE